MLDNSAVYQLLIDYIFLLISGRSPRKAPSALLEFPTCPSRVSSTTQLIPPEKLEKWPLKKNTPFSA
jgi:hypothetical protein